MKLSNKDILILLGIVVAIILTLTLISTDFSTVQNAGVKIQPRKEKSSLNPVTYELFRKVLPTAKTYSRI